MSISEILGLRMSVVKKLMNSPIELGPLLQSLLELAVHCHVPPTVSSWPTFEEHLNPVTKSVVGVVVDSSSYNTTSSRREAHCDNKHRSIFPFMTS
jgi:hypothetical protein